MKICLIAGCGRKLYCLGYCIKHYQRFRKYGNPFYTKVETHGMQSTPEYSSWNHMKKRCLNINCHAYPRYGGRGITVCDRWRYSFTAFCADMGLKPFPKAQIDRINNDLGYFPDNCRWVTQAENTRKGPRVKLNMKKAKEIRKLYKVGGITQAAIGLIYGIGRDSISLIVNNKQWV